MSMQDDDLIRDILRRVMAMAEGFTEAQALQVEEQIRHDWRGTDYYVAGLGTRHRPEVKRAAAAAVKSGAPLAEAAKKHGLGRATLYRFLKRN